MESLSIREKVLEGYRSIARDQSDRRSGEGGCCGSANQDPENLALQVGYSPEELAALPEGANLGLSCGNPNAVAALQPGEIVLDLGSGAGFDVFIAGHKVGASGRVIGVDMTAEMISRARRNTVSYNQATGLDNVEFRLGEIEHLPVADASVDVVISNCVINLSPDKPQVWREIARVLRPGGRVAISDLALRKSLPPGVSEMVEALVGCVAGAVLVSDTEQMVRVAGLHKVVLRENSNYVEAMVDWQDPLYQKIIALLPPDARPSDYITSLEIAAEKPLAAACCNRETQTVELSSPCCS
jgi:SAM-dependent methyltransferase